MRKAICDGCGTEVARISASETRPRDWVLLGAGPANPSGNYPTHYLLAELCPACAALVQEMGYETVFQNGFKPAATAHAIKKVG